LVPTREETNDDKQIHQEWMKVGCSQNAFIYEWQIKLNKLEFEVLHDFYE